jgi:hypothetical protein
LILIIFVKYGYMYDIHLYADGTEMVEYIAPELEYFCPEN